MPRRRRAGKAAYTVDSLTHGELWELVLGFSGQQEAGCVPSCHDLRCDRDGGCPTHFLDGSEARVAWWSLREELLAAAQPGVRPAGWWRWEQNRPRPRDQRAVLEEMGELQPWEVAALRAREAIVVP